MTNELTFVAKVISGRRITIDRNVFETLGLELGDNITVTLSKISGKINEENVIVEESIVK